MKKLHEQRLNWKPHGRNSPTWAIFCVNHESLVDVKVSQVMRCILCYNRPLSHVILEPRTKLRKGLVSNFKSNGKLYLKTCWCKAWTNCQKFWKTS
jgi:hypothetical protein